MAVCVCMVLWFRASAIEVSSFFEWSVLSLDFSRTGQKAKHSSETLKFQVSRCRLREQG